MSSAEIRLTTLGGLEVSFSFIDFTTLVVKMPHLEFRVKVFGSTTCHFEIKDDRISWRFNGGDDRGVVLLDVGQEEGRRLHEFFSANGYALGWFPN